MFMGSETKKPRLPRRRTGRKSGSGSYALSDHNFIRPRRAEFTVVSAEGNVEIPTHAFHADVGDAGRLEADAFGRWIHRKEDQNGYRKEEVNFQIDRVTREIWNE